MGYEVSKRPILAARGIQELLGSTFTTGVTFSGNVTFSGDVVLPTQKISTTEASARTITDHGVTVLNYASSNISTKGSGDLILPAPPSVGAVKEVFVIQNTSSEEVKVFHNGSGSFLGTTFNTITIAATTTHSAGTPYLRFVGYTTGSTGQWAATVGSTVSWDFSKTTGSSDQE